MKALPMTLSLMALLAAAATPTVQAEELSAGIKDVEANFFPFPWGPPGRPMPPPPGRPMPPPPPPAQPHPGHPGGPGFGRGEFLYQPVNQVLQGQNVLPLRQILGIGPDYRGRRVEYVMLRARTAAGRGQAAVTVNGTDVTGGQTVGTFTQDYYFSLPPHADEIGFEIQQLQIALQGNFTVDGVGVMLDGRGGPVRPGPGLGETIWINQEFRGGQRLALATLVDLGRYNGMRLRSISIRAATRLGRGDATFCGTNCVTVFDVGTVMADYTFPTSGDFVDWNARNWSIDLRGNFFVESIRLEFMR